MLFWNRQNKNAVFDLQNNAILRLRIRMGYYVLVTFYFYVTLIIVFTFRPIKMAGVQVV